MEKQARTRTLFLTCFANASSEENGLQAKPTYIYSDLENLLDASIHAVWAVTQLPGSRILLVTPLPDSRILPPDCASAHVTSSVHLFRLFLLLCM